MNNIRQHGISQLIPLLFTLFFAKSCTVLTQSQIDEVGKFARAAENYGNLPGAVMHAHAEVFLAEKTLNAAGFNDPESVTRKIDKGINDYQQLLKKSAAADDIAEFAERVGQVAEGIKVLVDIAVRAAGAGLV